MDNFTVVILFGEGSYETPIGPKGKQFRLIRADKCMVALPVEASCIKIVLLFLLLFLSPRVNHLTLSIFLISVLKACTKPTEENAGDKNKTTKQYTSTSSIPDSLHRKTFCVQSGVSKQLRSI